jgi:hypothetical protein
LRARSTDFGNFAADALELATGADLAIINAGAFRLDDMVGPALTSRDLQETFLYDHAHAVVTVNLTADEIRAIGAHAQRKSGQGAFVQVSRGFESPATRSGTVRTALVRHMLVDDEDGYQSLLASSRNCRPEKVTERIAARSAGGLIDLISSSARRGIAYSAVNRLAGTTDPDDRKMAFELFIGCIDRYAASCRSLGLKDGGLSLLDFFPGRTKLSERLAAERLLVRLLAMQLALTWGFKWVATELCGDLYKSDIQYRRTTPYHDYLDKALIYFDLRALYPRLKDEEGAPANRDAAAIKLTCRSHPPAMDPADDLGAFVSIFVEQVDRYRAICSEHNVACPECRQLLQADPNRQPLTEQLRDARSVLRHSLLVVLIGYGLQRVVTDFGPGLKALDAGAAQATGYYEYLAATLSFFDVVVPYGLLVDEETAD